MKVIINNNASLGQILWEQMVLGFPEFGVRFEQQLDFAPWAERAAVSGSRSSSADELRRRAERSPTPGRRSST